MRIKNSLKNIYISILTQIVITLLGFISRKVFLDSLGTEYLGVNGLLTNVLSMLSLVEGGIGTSIVYNLYKPLAENNQPKIIALVQLYKKLYSIIAGVIIVLSLMLYPFLGIIMKDNSSVTSINIIYFIFVAKNIISYLNAHKWSLITADQKGYILSKYNLIFNVITTMSKIIILVITSNYILFLIIEVLIFIIQNLWNGKVVERKYQYINTKIKYKVDNDVRNNLITNIKALFLHNVGSYCVFGTDNILISAFIGVKAVGIYSNYTMIISQLSALISTILNGIGSSVGNLIATESKEKSYEIFNIIYLLNFWIYCIGSIFLYNLLEPFINWWLGKNLLLDRVTFIIILLNFYISGMRSSIITFKTKAGIFVNDKYIPIIEAIINLGTSIILVKYFGLAGIFMGTTISTIVLPLWFQAKLVYNNIFKKSLKEYLEKYFIYLGLLISIGYLTTILCKLVYIDGFGGLVIMGIICITIPNLILSLIFYKTNEFKYIANILLNVIKIKRAGFLIKR